jgi:tRNA G18 (ribose-2'-O)-methylase SpoU
LEKEIVSLRSQKGKIRIVGMDNIGSAKPIEYYNWPSDEHVIMVFGQEQLGIPQELLDICDDLVYITQYGSVRSLNVGCASGVAMYDYCQKVVV